MVTLVDGWRLRIDQQIGPRFARGVHAMIWSRVRQVNMLRSLPLEYYPAALAAFGTDLAGRDALAVLAVAPSPEQGRRLSQARIETLLRRAGRQRNITATAGTIKTALGSQQLTARPRVVPAYAASASALIAVLTTMVAQTEVLAGQVGQGFGRHPDVEIYLSQPGSDRSSAPECWPSSATTPAWSESSMRSATRSATAPRDRRQRSRRRWRRGGALVGINLARVQAMLLGTSFGGQALVPCTGFKLAAAHR